MLCANGCDVEPAIAIEVGDGTDELVRDPGVVAAVVPHDPETSAAVVHENLELVTGADEIDIAIAINVARF